MYSNEMIKAIRRKHKMTVDEFSDFLGLPPHIIHNWESEAYSPPHYVVTLIARVFDECGRASSYKSDKDYNVK